MATILEVNEEAMFKSKEDILEFNRRNFPQIPQQETVSSENKDDPMAGLRSQMKKRVYAFNAADKESSSMKVAEMREKFKGIKGRIEQSRNERRPEIQKTDYLKLIRELENDADLITNIEGSL